MRAVKCCWLNSFVSEVIISGTNWLSERSWMASVEQPSSHSIFYSKNGSHTREFLELVNCLHDGLATRQVLSSVTNVYANSVLRNPKHLITLLCWIPEYEHTTVKISKLIQLTVIINRNLTNSEFQERR